MSSQEPTHRSFSTNQFFGRNPYDRSHRRYISSDDCPSSHDGSFADGDSRHYHSMDPYKGAPLNDCRGNLCWTPAGIGLRLVMGKYRGFSRYSGSFLDRHEVRVQIVNDHAITDLDLTADPHATGTVERDAKGRTRTEPRGEEEACRAPFMYPSGPKIGTKREVSTSSSTSRRRTSGGAVVRAFPFRVHRTGNALCPVCRIDGRASHTRIEQRAGSV